MLSQATCVVYTQTSRDSLHFLPLVKVVKANLDMSKANFWWTEDSLLVVIVHFDLCFCTAILGIPSLSWSGQLQFNLYSGVYREVISAA